jgi:hypothetical protein
VEWREVLDGAVAFADVAWLEARLRWLTSIRESLQDVGRRHVPGKHERGRGKHERGRLLQNA